MVHLLVEQTTLASLQQPTEETAVHFSSTIPVGRHYVWPLVNRETVRFLFKQIVLRLYWLHISYLNFKANSAGITPYVKKRMTKNADAEAIMEMSRSEINPSNYVALQSCQSTSASVGRSFLMFKKLLSKDRNFCRKMQESILCCITIIVNK